VLGGDESLIDRRTDLIDIAEDDALDGIVLQHFTDDTAIAATYDQDVLRVRMAGKRKMCDDLLISGGEANYLYIYSTTRGDIRTRFHHVRCTG
jgi:glutamine amidotransferase PdxT